MEEDFHTNDSMRVQLLEFLDRTFNYDGTTYLLAVSARESTGNGIALESHWRLRVALTYRENDTTVNPYWDGNKLEIALAGDSIRLLEESALTDEPPIIEGSPNPLAIDWVSEIAPPLWVSDEARKAATAKVVDEATRVDKRSAKEVIGHPPLELALILGLCAPVASCIHHISGGEVLLFHLCGNSTQGKTTAIMLSISTFGTPIVGHSSLLKDWNGTRNAILAQLRDIQGLPVAFDEASMLEGDYSNLIYQVASGKDKSRLDSEGMLRRSGQWGGSIISNGERSLSSSSSKNAGSQIRITELSNIPWTQSAENANRLKEGLLKHHGHAGPRFVEYLLTQGLDQLDMR